MRNGTVSLAALYLGASLALAGCDKGGALDGREYYKKGASEEETLLTMQFCEKLARSVATKTELGSTIRNPRERANVAFRYCMTDKGYRFRIKLPDAE